MFARHWASCQEIIDELHNLLGIVSGTPNPIAAGDEQLPRTAEASGPHRLLPASPACMPLLIILACYPDHNYIDMPCSTDTE